MKKALICPSETTHDSHTGLVLGWRVAQVEPDEQTFPIAEPYYWVSCADDVVADIFYYDPDTDQILPKPPQPPQPAAAEISANNS
jgi:hypothetical protein